MVLVAAFGVLLVFGAWMNAMLFVAILLFCPILHLLRLQGNCSRNRRD
jgi:hypothetical protein